MPGLRADHDARTASGDDVPEFLEHERGAMQTNLQDCRRQRLRSRETGCMNDAGGVADTGFVACLINNRRFLGPACAFAPAPRSPTHAAQCLNLSWRAPVAGKRTLWLPLADFREFSTLDPRAQQRRLRTIRIQASILSESA